MGDKRDKEWDRAVRQYENYKRFETTYFLIGILLLLSGIVIAFFSERPYSGVTITFAICVVYLKYTRLYFTLARRITCPCCVGATQGLPIRRDQAEKMGYNITDFVIFAACFLHLAPWETSYAILLDVLIRRGTIKPEHCLPGLICSKAELDVFEKNGISIDQPHRMDDNPEDDTMVRDRGRATIDAGIDADMCKFTHSEWSPDSNGIESLIQYYWIPDTDNVGPIIRAMYGTRP